MNPSYGKDDDLSRQIAELRHGDHVCMVYETRAEQIAAAVPFVLQGLHNGDCCAYIADDQTIDEVLAALATAGVDVEREQARGALQMLTKRESYLRSGTFDPHGMIDFLRETVEAALRAGFTGFRVTGEMTWALGCEGDCRELVEYEALLNQFFPHSRALAICQYNRERFSPQVIKDVLRTHPLAVLGGQVCSNVYYEPPELILGGGDDAQHVEWMISQLKKTQQLTNQRRAALQKAKESEAELRLVADNVSVFITRCSRDFRYRFVNAPYAARLGLKPEEIVGRSIPEVLGERAFAAILPYIRRVLAGETFDFEIEVDYEPNRPAYVHCYYVPERDAAGEVVGWVAAVTDISERRRAELALQQSEQRLRAVMESQAEMLCRFRPDGTILFANGAYARTLGTTPDDLCGQNFWRFVAPADRAAVERMLDSLSPAAPEVSIENRLETANGEIWTLWTNRALEFDENGRWTEAQSAGFDITQRKRAEGTVSALLRISERLNSSLDVETLLDLLVQEAIPLVSAESGVSGLLTAEGMVSKRYFQRGKVLPLEYCWPPGHGLPGWLIEHRRPYLTNEALTDTQIVRTLCAQFGVRTALSTPILTAEGELICFFEIHNKKDGSGFTKSDEQLLVAVSQVAAIAVQNALAYQRLQQAEENLKESDRRKDEFLALLAHELRNPLAPLRNGLQLLRLAKDEREIELTRDMMDRQLSYMVRLIDDLLDISRISRNKLELRRTRLLLSDVISSAVETARPAIDAAAHELTVALPPEPIYLDADLTRLAQVFANLLSNSAKYTHPRGKIWLSACREGEQVAVSVRDTGIGIPAFAISNVFQMFSQVDRSLERAAGGLGIGLALVKGLVEQHGGTVEATSPGEGQGSTFVVRLNVLPPRDTRLDTHAPHVVPAPHATRRRILVVDDNRDAATTMAMMLHLIGNEVQTANDGEQAIVVAEQFRPQVILMDLGMPKLNGYEATRRLRAQAWAASTVIVALTGWGQETDRAKTSAAGFDGHLVKPVTLSELEVLLAAVKPANHGNGVPAEHAAQGNGGAALPSSTVRAGTMRDPENPSAKPAVDA